MRNIIVFYLSQVIAFGLNAAHPDLSGRPDDLLHDWKKNTILTPTEKKPARTAVLIIAPPVMGNCFTSNRWKLGKKVWEQYMNSNPHVDCYFLQSTNPRTDRNNSDQVWIEKNTIYIGDWWYEKHQMDRILHKTIVAIEFLLSNYTHFIRTNLNAFLDLNKVDAYMSTHHQSFYSTPIWQGSWYAIGYSIVFTSDVAKHIAKEYRRLESIGEELISPDHADDGAIASLASGVWLYDKQHPFRCCPSLPFGERQLMCRESLLPGQRLSKYGAWLEEPIFLEEALQYCKKSPATTMLYRPSRKLKLSELAHLYTYLLESSYPTIPHIDLLDYVSSLSNI